MPGNRHPEVLDADAGSISRAVGVLRDGEIVALPTETVYGLAARADSDAAVAAIYRAKGRPDFNPLIVHVASLADAARLAETDHRAKALAAAFWPGALTMVLPRRTDAPLAAAVTAGLPTVAVRCPAHPVMRAVLAEADFPLAAPSANRSGAVSPTTAAHVAASLAGRIGLVIDGGPCTAGIESTIVALRPDGGWQVLRPGPIAQAALEDILGQASATTGAGAIEAPGHLASHYAPGKPVRLNAPTADAGEFHIGFGAIAGDVSLSETGDLAEAAARLYAVLHLAASSLHPRIAVAPIPGEGMGLAINDRLHRAAA